jgi:predicted small metal-binding protein
MGRKHLECHEQAFPGGPECGAYFTADTDKALLEEAGRHAITVHGHANTESLREQLLSMIKESAPH